MKQLKKLGLSDLKVFEMNKLRGGEDLPEVTITGTRPVTNSNIPTVTVPTIAPAHIP
jgi:hypothetical protein